MRAVEQVSVDQDVLISEDDALEGRPQETPVSVDQDVLISEDAISSAYWASMLECQSIRMF